MPDDRPAPPLAHELARALDANAATLGAHWQTRARRVAPRLEESTPAGERATAAVRALAASLGGSPAASEGLLLAGWDHGVWAHSAGLPLHVLLKELDLLLAIVLFAAERAADRSGADGAPAVDALRVARRLHGCMSLLSLAATKGYTHRYLRARRTRLRALRHDLRNPLATIQSAAALMQDSAIPEPQRRDPRYADMVSRNARVLETMVRRQLADESAVDAELGEHQLALRDLVLAVRRAMREEAAAVECTVTVDEALPWVRTDAVGLELALRAMLAAGIRLASRGASLRLTGTAGEEGATEDGLRLTLRADPSLAAGDPSALASASTVAERVGARLVVAATELVLEIPGVLVQSRGALPAGATAARPPSESVAHATHDVAGSGERQHG
ncbi:MAG TPA: histidine kinase dimerization/phospho-acceptor domain-containing protein [Gemmatimonadaceae bacterium]|nr:histidine kinase dimerization/phospho-acceptor domain-containing protein [Gemmatimonadaceae bacterium]